MPDPEWPPCVGNIRAAHGVPVPCPLHESLGWRYDLDELESKITPKTRAIYINSPHNPTGGVLTRADIEAHRRAVRERHDLWLISDEAYEDVVFDGAEHVSTASLPGHVRADDFALHLQQDLRDDRPAPRLRRGAGRDAARADEEGALLHRQQRLVGRAVRRRSARSKDRRTASRRSATSCRRGAICSTRASASTPAASSPARRRRARSTRSCGSIPTGGRRRRSRASRCRGR